MQLQRSLIDSFCSRNQASLLSVARCGWSAGFIALLSLTLSVPVLANDLVFGDGFDPPPAISTSTNMPQSLQRVGIDGLPPDWRRPGDVFVEFLNVAGGSPMPVEVDENGLFINAPFHPAFPEQGGGVTLRALRGGTRSMPFSLELRPLDDVPGALADLVATLRAHIDGFARQRGTTFEALQQMSFEDTPDALLPLKYAQSFVNDPSNPNSLAFIADGSSDFLNAGELRLLDQISGYTDLAALVRLEIDALGDLESQTGAAIGKFSRQAQGRSGGMSDGAVSCIDSGPDINSAEELSAAMWEAKFAEIAVSGNPGQTLNALSATLSAGSALPIYGRAFLAAGAATAAWQASRNALAGLNPSEFVSITAETTRQRFEEDSEASGTYFNVQATAASTGWTVDQAIVDAVITALSAFASPAQVAQFTAADFLKSSAVNLINQGMSNYVGAREGGLVNFCPQQWTVSISSTDWSEARSVFGHFDIDGANFRPNAVEEDFLSVSNIAARFGQEKIDIDIPIGVDPIEVTVSPSPVQVTQPGEVKMITATIENAVSTGLFWDPGAGTWDDGLQQPTNDGGTRPLRTPGDPDAYPFIVEVESLSRSGLRADNSPPRRDAVLVRLIDEIIVSPANACLEPGDPEQFTATQGDAPAEVTWSLESTGNSPSNLGSITQSGLYTAPASDSGEVLVVAASVDDPDVRGIALVEVGSCECFWSLSIANEGGWSGREAGHSFPSFIGQPFVLAFFPETGIGGGNAQAFTSPPAPGQTGTFPIELFGFQIGARSWVVSGDPDDGTTATMIVEENINQAVLTGSVSGTALTVINGEDFLRSFDLNFRSAGVEGSCE